ncbi:MAG TPA: antitoxin Xre/MbcA/ParS toxin-binding domain-containing protein [Steroidobacteraceae bacterium]|nr:antitoxin Xre/MbcA/ParS toxin-binding domain-containing protein [Steroidobacteraceae bacterium]
MESEKSRREPVVSAVYERLGGHTTFGREVSSDADLAQVVSRRIPLKALKHVQSAGTFTDGEIQEFIIPARTRRHRAEKKERLTVEESDRLVRLTRIQAIAEDVLGDTSKAHKWLRQPLGELGGRPPLELARTEAGARVIEQILARIDWGAVA